MVDVFVGIFVSVEEVEQQCCGLMLVLLFLFGVGKLIIVWLFLEKEDNLVLFILVMIWLCWFSEVDGVYYYFFDLKWFE